MYGPPQHTPEDIDRIRKFRTWLSTNQWLIEGLDPDKEEARVELEQMINNLNKAPTSPDWYEYQLHVIEEIIGTESQDLEDKDLEEETQELEGNELEEEIRQNNTLDESSEEA